jgi:hypothetical protein
LFVPWHFETINEQFYAVYRMVGYEGLEVINPDGGAYDAEAEFMRGQWKQEVRFNNNPFFLKGITTFCFGHSALWNLFSKIKVCDQPA